MKRSSKLLISSLVGCGLFAAAEGTLYAQCTTCVTPAPAAVPTAPAVVPTTQVAYYQPTVVYQPYQGWYPGRFFDRWRMTRWFGTAQPATVAPAATVTTAYAPAYTAAYAPTYTTSYAPTYTTSYAPAYSDHTALYTPAYASATPVTANYAPATVSYVAPATYTAAYAPAPAAAPSVYLTPYAPLQRTTVLARPVVMRPVVALQPVATTSCDPCSGVGQASYAYEAAPSGCASCADGASAPLYSAPAASAGGVYTGPATPQPALGASESVPMQSQYRGGVDANAGANGASAAPGSLGNGAASNGAAGNGAAGNGAAGNGAGGYGLEGAGSAPAAGALDPRPIPAEPQAPAAGSDPAAPATAPNGNGGTGSETYYDRLQAPQLLAPQVDRTASRVSVDVRPAVYQRPATAERRYESARPVSLTARQQAEQDAEGWGSRGND